MPYNTHVSKPKRKFPSPDGELVGLDVPPLGTDDYTLPNGRVSVP
ncbi:conserved protein of unknown function [Limnospira indica PCC 8005]|uniref:Uncharacterized protein n=1 Tax=Limnospira indica PCC 8005 TaxID=376219 RepID=A0A9P1KJT0_9CYAN|nr:conserved protein of unknown function [Limnospira indica PCC 8005]